MKNKIIVLTLLALSASSYAADDVRENPLDEEKVVRDSVDRILTLMNRLKFVNFFSLCQFIGAPPAIMASGASAMGAAIDAAIDVTPAIIHHERGSFANNVDETALSFMVISQEHLDVAKAAINMVRYGEGIKEEFAADFEFATPDQLSLKKAIDTLLEVKSKELKMAALEVSEYYLSEVARIIQSYLKISRQNDHLEIYERFNRLVKDVASLNLLISYLQFRIENRDAHNAEPMQEIPAIQVSWWVDYLASKN